MDKQREKLIELLNETFDEQYEKMRLITAPHTAKHLLADEEIKRAFELLKAEEEGRLIETPCKVGDTVYTHNVYVWSHECRNCEHFIIGGFGDPNECGRTEDGSKHPDCIQIKETVVTQHDILYYLCFDKFGKTVFLSHKDAEKALEERKD